MLIPIENRRIILMPFCAKTLLIYHALKKARTSIYGFIDNDRHKQGNVYDGVLIYSPENAFEEDKETIIILNEIKYLYQMKKQLFLTGFRKIYYCDMFRYTGTPEEIFPLIDINTLCKISKYAPSQIELLESYVANVSWVSYFEALEIKEFSSYEYYNDINAKRISGLSTKLLLCINATKYYSAEFFCECIDSINLQEHETISLLIISTANNAESIISALPPDVDFLISEAQTDNFDIFSYVRHNYDINKYDYIMTIESNDTLATGAIDIIIGILVSDKPAITTAYEDRLYNNKHIAPYYKDDYIEDEIITNKQLLRQLIIAKPNAVDSLYNNQLKESLLILPMVLYHYRVITDFSNDNHIMPVAFYLPQFHPIPENDFWWGEGFTEWKNVKRACPLFSGHYQPHEPGQLGYYDLVSEKDIQYRQVELAKKHGIYGFCFYYYWFNGKRLLERPLDQYVNNGLDFPFCICWANENWTRCWDGQDNEILIEQKHNRTTDEQFILDIIPLIKDPRYIKINTAPLLLIYNPSLFPNFNNTVTMWRKICALNGIPEIHISCVQTFKYINPDIIGADSAVEFPPLNTACGRFLNDRVNDLSSDFTGVIYDYSLYTTGAMNERKKQYLYFRGIIPGWDNTARRLNEATIIHNSSPEEYKKWLMSLVDFTSRYSEENRFIFINAWNEWAEGAYLEPDKKYGDAYLQATKEALIINV